MSKRVFLSFRHADLNFLNNLAGLFQANNGKIQATPSYVTEDVAAKGDEAVKKEISAKMKGCYGVLLLVSNTSHSSNWIDFEVAEASRLKIPCVAVRHPQVKGGLGKHQGHIEVIDWDAQKIADVVATWKAPEASS